MQLHIILNNTELQFQIVLNYYRIATFSIATELQIHIVLNYYTNCRFILFSITTELQLHIVLNYDWIETTLSKYFSVYEQMRTFQVEFLSFWFVAFKLPDLIRYALPNYWFSSISYLCSPWLTSCITPSFPWLSSTCVYLL